MVVCSIGKRVEMKEKMGIIVDNTSTSTPWAAATTVFGDDGTKQELHQPRVLLQNGVIRQQPTARCHRDEGSEREGAVVWGCSNVHSIANALVGRSTYVVVQHSST